MCGDSSRNATRDTTGENTEPQKATVFLVSTHLNFNSSLCFSQVHYIPYTCHFFQIHYTNKIKSFKSINILFSQGSFSFVLFCGYIEVYPSELPQLRCTVPNLPWKVTCLWYSVWLSQLHGEDNTENTIKNCSL